MRKSAGKSASKTAKKTAKKSATKAAKKTVRKTVKPTVKRTVRKSAGKKKATRLGRFIADLATNPDKLRVYRADPEGAMAAGGLADDEKAVLRTGDFRTICDHFGGVKSALVVGQVMHADYKG